MTNELQVFDFNKHTVRVIMQGNEPWWVAKDVCDVLGLNNITEALRSLDEDELSSEILKSGGQGREMKLISESGLYTLIMRSNKPAAKQFKRWVTHEVLPSIRKTGAYIMPSKIKKFDPKKTSLNSLLLDIGWKRLSWEE